MKVKKQIFLGLLIAEAAELLVQRVRITNKLKMESEMAKKNEEIIKIYSHWIRLKQNDKSLSCYLKERGYKKIAIYGMHYLGESLFDDLMDTDVEIKYMIDKNAERIYRNYSSIPVYKPDEKLDEVDVVIVTAFIYFKEIQEQLEKQLDCPVLSLKEILYEL